MIRLMDTLASSTLDQGTEHFDPSTIAIVTIDTGNPATNIIPSQSHATVNIRFNDIHSSASLTKWLEVHTQKIGAKFGVKNRNAGPHLRRELLYTARRII